MIHSIDFSVDDLFDIDEVEFCDLEKRVNKLIAIWEVNNLRGAAAIFHNDNHRNERRRNLYSELHKVDEKNAFIRGLKNGKQLVRLEGHMLIHPLTTPVVEIDNNISTARAIWWSFGIEGLALGEAEPMAVFSLGMVPGIHVREHSEWKILSGAWQRTTKNEYHKGWIEDMQPTNAYPPLTPEQDRKLLGKYAYRKDEMRQPVPEPPHPDTFEAFIGEEDDTWLYANLNTHSNT